LTDQQTDFCLGYLNQHHGPFLYTIATSLSEVADEMAQANAWSGGSYAIINATAEAISTNDMTLNIVVQKRGGRIETRRVSVPLNPTDVTAVRRRLKTVPPPVPEVNGDNDTDDSRLPIDDVCRKLGRLAWMVGHPDVSGKLIQLAIQLDGAGIGKLPENMQVFIFTYMCRAGEKVWHAFSLFRGVIVCCLFPLYIIRYLNQVPHNRYVRQYFYDTAARAIRDAVVNHRDADGMNKSNNKNNHRMKIVASFPETNPSMDSYRIGTLLELVRTAAITLAKESGKRVRICVQGSMGVGIFTGLPKQLSGVARLVQMMDWQSGPGELCEGIVGEYVRFGAVGPQHVQDDDDCFLIIAPQSMVGAESSIFPLLKAMVDKAGPHRPVILLNPDLTDKISAAGQQSVRGRQERIDFAESFATIYEFSNIYVSGTSYFPILGAMTKLHPSEPWIAHQRRDFYDDKGVKGEIYVPILSSEVKPDGESILEYFEK
jgi:adenylate kinase